MKALISGVTGQDGSYLADLLLSKGYEVHGIKRRSSSFNTSRVDHLMEHPNFHLHYGDLCDPLSIERIMAHVDPDEIYNLGAQSHVAVSFEMPAYTLECVAGGTLAMLEAMRHCCPRARFYQASSSEMFGNSPAPQSETTPFAPRSPYGVAKVAAHHMALNYRESYGLHVSCGILFNHECLDSTTPLMIRKYSGVTVCSVSDLAPYRKKGANVQSFDMWGKFLHVWDGSAWTQVKTITATKRRTRSIDHKMLSVESRAGICRVTAHHSMLNSVREEIPAGDIKPGDEIALFEAFPQPEQVTGPQSEMAEFLGLMAADGYISEDGRHAQFTKNNDLLRIRVAVLWRSLFMGQSRHTESTSGFSDKKVWQLILTGCNQILPWLRSQLYTSDAFKKIPDLILNSDAVTQRVFLDAHYAGDGLKAGNGDGVKTNSAVLAQGLVWLYGLQGRTCSVYAEHRGDATYYQLNLSGARNTGLHLRKPPQEIRKVVEIENPCEWVFDLETESGVFAAGVGRMVVHNSPRRGETFVTRKISMAVAKIKLGMQDKLILGNLEAERDWGWAPEYVQAMWMMLQREKPGDFVIGTGVTETVRNFAAMAFGSVDLDWQKYVEYDAAYERPAEVHRLQADPTKARHELGWEYGLSVSQIAHAMVFEDMEAVKTK